MFRPHLAWLLAIAASLVPVTASAQDDRAAATPIFEEGVALAQEGQWDQALERFERAYELYSHPNIRLNLAAAQAETGRLLASLETYEALLEEVEGVSRRVRRRRRFPATQTIRDALQRVRERIPSLAVSVPGAEEGDVVRLDAAARDIADLAEPVQVDPGEHTIEWVRAGQILGRQTVTLEEGGQARVTVEALAEEEADLPPPDEPGREPGGGGDDPTLLITGAALIGVGVAALGGMAVFMGLIDGLNGNPELLSYRAALPLETMACAEAEAGATHGLPDTTRQSVVGVCGDAATFEVLQYVMMATGIAAAGVGLALVIVDATSSEEGSSATLRPRLSPTQAGLELSGAF